MASDEDLRAAGYAPPFGEQVADFFLAGARGELGLGEPASYKTGYESTEEGVFRYKEVVQPSGHGTIRLIVSETSDVQAVRDLLRQLGCSSELSHLPRLIAVDVPPSVSLQELKKVLDAGQEQDRWGYEEACLPQV